MVWRCGAAQKKFNGSAIEKVINFLAARPQAASQEGSAVDPGPAAAGSDPAGLERAISGTTEMGSPGRLNLAGQYKFMGGLRGLNDAVTQKLWQVGVLASYLHSTRLEPAIHFLRAVRYDAAAGELARALGP